MIDSVSLTCINGTMLHLHKYEVAAVQEDNNKSHVWLRGHHEPFIVREPANEILTAIGWCVPTGGA